MDIFNSIIKGQAVTVSLDLGHFIGADTQFWLANVLNWLNISSD